MGGWESGGSGPSLRRSLKGWSPGQSASVCGLRWHRPAKAHRPRQDLLTHQVASPPHHVRHRLGFRPASQSYAAAGRRRDVALRPRRRSPSEGSQSGGAPATRHCAWVRLKPWVGLLVKHRLDATAVHGLAVSQIRHRRLSGGVGPLDRPLGRGARPAARRGRPGRGSGERGLRQGPGGRILPVSRAREKAMVRSWPVPDSFQEPRHVLVSLRLGGSLALPDGLSPCLGAIMGASFPVRSSSACPSNARTHRTHRTRRIRREDPGSPRPTARSPRRRRMSQPTSGLTQRSRGAQ